MSQLQQKRRGYTDGDYRRNRASCLPHITILDKHPLVQNNTGRIVLLTGDWSDRGLLELKSWAAGVELPTNLDKIHEQGFEVLCPSDGDVVVFRDCNESGQPEADRVVSWAIMSTNMTEDQVEQLKKVRDRILGPKPDRGAEKAYRAGNGLWTGGVAYERSPRAVPTANGPRCYQVGNTLQKQRMLMSPGVQNKTYQEPHDDHLLLQRDILKVGADVAISGLRKAAPKNMIERIDEHAELTNLARTGVDSNTAYPSMQLNIASAVIKGKAKPETFKRSLGKFAGSHIDNRDSPGVPTAMMVLSEPHPDMEDEYFHIVDLGISWKLEEFAVIYFSGLHRHGGCQPVYKARKRSPPSEGYTRLTLIAYPPKSMLDGDAALAFAALPKGELLKLSIEMRNPLSHRLSERGHCEQTTYVADGTAIMESQSHLNHVARGLTEFVSFIIHQADPKLLFRLDRDRFLSSFSLVIDNKRVQADPWSIGPGWSGEDTEPGRSYTTIFEKLGVDGIDQLSEEQLAKLHNSDTMSNAPFGNPRLEEANNRWASHLEDWAQHVPICAVGKSQGNTLGGRSANKRKSKKPRDVESEDSSLGDLSPKVNKKRRKAKKKSDSKHQAVGDGSESSDQEVRKRQRLDKGKAVERTPRLQRPSPSPSAELLTESVHSESESSGEDTITPAASQAPADAFSDPGASLDQAGQSARDERALDTYLMNGLSLPVLESLIQDLRSSYDCHESEAFEHTTERFANSCGSPSNPVGLSLPQFPSQLEPVKIVELTQALCSFVQSGKKVHAEMLAIRQIILLLNVLLWDWLEEYVEDAVKKFVSQNMSHPLSPIISFAEKVLLLPDEHKDGIIIDAAVHFPGFAPGQRCETLLPPPGRRQIRYDSITPARLTSLATSFLARLLGYPKEEKFRPGAWVTKEICIHLGVEALCLPSVWKAAHSVSSLVLRKARHSHVLRHEISTWSSSTLAKANACLPDSMERALILQAHGIVGQSTAFKAELGSLIALARSFSRPTTFPLPSAPKSSSRSSCNSAPIPMPDEQALERFFLQIDLLLPIVDRPMEQDPVSTGRSEARAIAMYRNNVRQHSDRLLPFRDFAPSRRRVLVRHGPFSPENLRTRGGLFSALMFRGVLFNTPCLQDYGCFFSNLGEWEALYNRLKVDHPDDYFCNIKAYGQPSRHRSLSNAAAFWRASGNKALSDWLYSSAPTDFQTLFARLRDSPLLPSVGNLTAFLIVADYASAGIVAEPDPKTMGIIVKEIGLGALRGLQALGLPLTSTPSETGVFFDAVYQFLHKKIPDGRKTQIRFGTVFLEHSLCKLKRLDTALFEGILEYM